MNCDDDLYTQDMNVLKNKIKNLEKEIDSLKTAIIAAYRLIVMVANRSDNFRLSKENRIQIKQLLAEHGIDSDWI